MDGIIGVTASPQLYCCTSELKEKKKQNARKRICEKRAVRKWLRNTSSFRIDIIWGFYRAKFDEL